MHARIRIDRAQSADRPILVHLLTMVGLDARRLECKLSHWFVARHGEQIVGCGAVYLDGTWGALHSVAVLSSHQRRSIGSTLVGVLLDHAAELRATMVYTGATPEAAGFFQRMRWRVVDGEEAMQLDSMPLDGAQVFATPLAALQKTA
jgi:N-acetylglutamate synthase-like GNAT family acetyltransferase